SLHPIHLFSSMATIPSALLLMAPVGHTFIQEGSSHCMHIIGTDIAASSYMRTDTLAFLGLKALILLKEQTISQVLQPIHFSGDNMRILLNYPLVTGNIRCQISPPFPYVGFPDTSRPSTALPG